MVFCGYCFARKNALKRRHIGAVKAVNGKDCKTAKTAERQKASRSDNRKPFARTNIYIVGKPNKKVYIYPNLLVSSITILSCCFRSLFLAVCLVDNCTDKDTQLEQ